MWWDLALAASSDGGQGPVRRSRRLPDPPYLSTPHRKITQICRSRVRPSSLVSALPGYLDHVTVDHEGKTPLYLQIAAILRGQIERGEIAPGRPVPSETQLMQEHGVARLTARKAVRVLADEGLVEVVQGRGAYVTEAPRQP